MPPPPAPPLLPSRVVAAPTLDVADCSSVLRVGQDAFRQHRRAEETWNVFFSFSASAGVTFALCLRNSEAVLQSRQSDDSPDSTSWGPVRSTWSDRWLGVDVQPLFLLLFSFSYFLFSFTLMMCLHRKFWQAQTLIWTISPSCLVTISTYK